jgi:hypothetical protein
MPFKIMAEIYLGRHFIDGIWLGMDDSEQAGVGSLPVGRNLDVVRGLSTGIINTKPALKVRLEYTNPNFK